MTTLDVRTASWEELEAAGLCDCGQALEGHPPLPRPAPLSRGRGGRRPLSQQPTMFHTRGRKFVIKAHHQQQQP